MPSLKNYVSIQLKGALETIKNLLETIFYIIFPAQKKKNVLHNLKKKSKTGLRSTKWTIRCYNAKGDILFHQHIFSTRNPKIMGV